MKKHFFVLLLSFSCLKFSSAQVLCVYCYDQNDTISANVNNLILNGGFENGCGIGGYFCPNSSQYSCDITNWTCIGGGINTYAEIKDNSFSFIPEGTKAPYFGNQWGSACSAVLFDTSCIYEINCTVSGIPAGYPTGGAAFGGALGVSLEQTVNGLITDSTYVLEFWAGGESSGWPGMGIFGVDVGFGYTLLRDRRTPYSGGIGTRYLIEFKATSSSHTIKFTNWGHICQQCTELVLDDVRLYTLAELDASVPHCSLGIDASPSFNMTSVFPNPVRNELNIKTNNNELSEIILYDIASRKLLEQTFINSASVNTEELSKGIYFYEIKNKEGVVKKGKVAKE